MHVAPGRRNHQGIDARQLADGTDGPTALVDVFEAGFRRATPEDPSLCH
jgi:hypothetical protein